MYTQDATSNNLSKGGCDERGNVKLTKVELFFKRCVAIKIAVFVSKSSELTSESVQGASLAFQGVDDIHSGDGLPLGVLGVSDSITDDIFQENFQDTAGFFVDQARDTFDSTTTSETTDGWFGDTLDVIT